jgi:beta-galactosidase GanA
MRQRRSPPRARHSLTAALVSAGLALSAASAAPAPGAPKLVSAGGRTRLEVDGHPFLILGGELANSSAGSLGAAKAALGRLKGLGLNTVLVPVSWELVEPQERKLDFALVGGIVREARRDHLHVVVLWFGSWKNGMSSYVPGWIKRDEKRFPRAQAIGDHGVESLSAFSATNRDTDARAFAALMRYLRAVDGRAHTVLMVQVENEVGMIGEAADRSGLASAAWTTRVPAEAISALAPAGAPGGGVNWAQLLGSGPGAEERFQAWHFARYVDTVARAGKAEYPLPLFVNAALNGAGLAPGKYPSAGPLPHLFAIWKAGAPTIDFLAPDIYFPGFAAWSERYRRSDNPLFIPEARNSDDVAVNVLYAAGQQALGVSPFAVDAISAGAGAGLTRAYQLLAELAPSLLAAAPGRSAGVLVEKEAPTTEVTIGGFKLTVSHDYTFPWASPARNDPTWPRGGGLVIALADDEYLVAGNGIIVTFAPARPGDPMAGLERVDEGRFENGRFVVTRRLNGDETHQGRQVRLPMGDFGLQRVKLYRYR